MESTTCGWLVAFFLLWKLLPFRILTIAANSHVGEGSSQFVARVSEALSQLSPKKYELKTVNCDDLSGGNGAGHVLDIVIISPNNDAKKVLSQLSGGGYISEGSPVVVFDSGIKTEELQGSPQTPISIFRATDPCESWRLPISYVVVHKCIGTSEEVASKVEELLGYIYTGVHIVCDENAFDQAPLFCKYITSIVLVLKTCIEDIAAARKVDVSYDSSAIMGQNISSIARLLISNNFSSEALSIAVSTPNGITAAFCTSLKKEGIDKELRRMLCDLTGGSLPD